jgi:hypothetical protein
MNCIEGAMVDLGEIYPVYIKYVLLRYIILPRCTATTPLLA